jgi:asparagine synthase (glutamine-hydrolysing)
MCGFAGVLQLDGAPVDAAALERMRCLQRHRGPDDHGTRFFSLRRGASRGFRRGEVPGNPEQLEGGIGFNRLAIQDLSEHGHQPMLSRDGSVILAFNGEIYNAPELRHELQGAGIPFRGHSDTEVLLALHERHGLEGMLERSNGMFSICLVDLRAREVVLARDRLGIKPLYWAEFGGTLLFSTEVKSFLAWPGFPLELEESAVDECLLFRFCADEGHLLRAVRALRPGHYRRIGLAGASERRYWSVPDPDRPLRISFPEAVEGLEARLERSVQAQLLADVKVGCQLSGGIDSSTVTVFARRHFDADMDAFSIVFEDARFSEDPWISRAANAAHADSHRYPMGAEYVIEHLERASWHLDQPINVPNSVGIYHLAERARSLVTVLLSGEGADEVFGGYNRFYYAATREAWRGWLPALRLLPGIGPRLARRYGDPRETDATRWFVGMQAYLTGSQLARLRPDARADPILERRRAIFAEGRGSYLANCMRYDIRTWLVDLLNRQDKMTMAHSLENRVPMLDHELVGWARSLPGDYLVSPVFRLRGARARSTKRVLKQLASRHFGEDFVYRRKVGFGLPLGAYYAHPRFAELMQERLLPGIEKRGLLQGDVVRRWWREGKADPKGRHQPIWSAIALELWAQQFLDGGWRRFEAGAR